jgi:hypothetical protein
MYLVQILLPVHDNDGDPLPQVKYRRVAAELSERFGGVTAFTRAPAEGQWKEAGRTEHDEIVVFEVMTEELDRRWWKGYRRTLEKRFKQDVVIIRAQPMEQL